MYINLPATNTRDLCVPAMCADTLVAPDSTPLPCNHRHPKRQVSHRTGHTLPLPNDQLGYAGTFPERHPTPAVLRRVTRLRPFKK